MQPKYFLFNYLFIFSSQCSAEFLTREDMNNAIKLFNDAEFYGRKVTAAQAKRL